MDTQTLLRQVLGGAGHIYLLRQRHREAYKIVGSPLRLAGRNLERALEDVDLVQSLVLVFRGPREHSDHLAEFRRNDTQFLAPGHVTRTTRWYVKAGRDALLAQAARGNAAVVVPMDTLHPTDMVALEALTTLDLAIRDEQRLLREAKNAESHRKWKEEQAREQEAENCRIQEMREALWRQALAADDVITESTASEVWGSRVSKRLGFLARVANGHCELRLAPDNGYELVFYVFPAHRGKLHTALQALTQTRVVCGTLLTQEEVPPPESYPLFGPVSWGASTRSGAQQGTLGVARNTPALLPALRALTPGVRGWDLPRDAATYGFDPSRRRRYTAAVQAPDEDAVAE